MSTLNISPFVVRATVIASLGGILFGYDLAVISAALPQITETFNLSENQQEMLVSFLYIGCCFGAIIGGVCCDTFGRKRTIIMTDILFFVSASVLFTAGSFGVVLVGRLIVGAAVAISGIADVAYLHEISPKEYRGAIVSCNEACISLGFLMSYLCGYFISIHDPNDGWRYMFGLASIIAVIQLIFMFSLPESPVWLAEKGRTEELDRALAHIESIESACRKKADSEKKHIQKHDGDTSRSKLFEDNFQNAHEGSYSSFNVEDGEVVENTPPPKNDLNSIQIFRSHYRQVIISVFLSIMQQFCGHPNVLNFAHEIFGQIGFNTEVGRLYSVMLVGVVKFTVTCVVIWKIEEIGRRKLLLFGMTLIAASLLLLTLVYSINDLNNQSLFGKVIASVSVFGVAAGYAASFGPLVWLLVSELFPSAVRGRALSGSTITSYAAAAIVSYTFLSFQKSFGLAVPFGLYFILTTFSIIFTVLAIPDTANMTSEEIMLRLETMWWWQRRSARNKFAPAKTNEISSVQTLNEII